MLINATKISKKNLNKILFDNANFVINDTDKIGLIGVNGVGKSTLLKIIMKEVELDSGEISYKKDIKIGYLPQESNFNPLDTILDAINKETDIEVFEAKTILSKMGLNDYTRIIQGMSGGEIKRLALAIALAKKVDLLLLDEPTNHLDVWMINWLEKYLIKFNRGLLLVTHDRYFLERVTKKIMEIDHGSIFMYDTSYSGFLDEKAQRYLNLQARERKLAAIFKKEAAWAKMNPQARTTKSVERLARFESLKSELASAKQDLKVENYDLTSLKSRMGKTTIEIENIRKSIGDRVLFQDFSYNVLKNDRLGIVGENGSGKTTLFKTVLGILPPDSGTIKIGETIKVGYFSQVDLDFSKPIKLIDYILQFGEYVDTVDGKISASQLLDNYLFPPQIQQSTINRLSGGEKRRLQLLSVLITNPNILFLDEPTNDLDIYTLDILENYLETFKGAVIVVSHDRYFLDKVVDHLFVFEDGIIKEYNQLVSDYLESHPRLSKVEGEIVKEKVVQLAPRFTSQEKKEYDRIEEDIAGVEEKINQCKKELETITTDYEKIISINNQVDELNSKLDQLLERWEYLENLNQQILEYKQKKYNGEL